MKHIVKMVLRLAAAGIIFGMANIYSIIGMLGMLWLIPVLLFGFLIINVFPSVFNMGLQSARLRICSNGCELLYLFLLSIAASVEESAVELVERIKQILEETGAPKINIIAHSKGGLDCRYAISMLGADQYVASITTINTPHRGCEFADYLLSKLPQKDKIAGTYNAALKKLGNHKPDFLAAVSDLTASVCEARNKIVKNAKSVYYQSIGSKLNISSSGRFPLNFSYRFVHSFDGPNDGLVGAASNVQLVKELKKKGFLNGRSSLSGIIIVFLRPLLILEGGLLLSHMWFLFFLISSNCDSAVFH